MEIAIQIIRVKVSALYLNPSGIGIISQLSSLQNLLKKIVELGIGGGVTKYIAEYHGKTEYKKVNGVYKTAFSGFALTGIVLIIAVSSVSNHLAKILLGSSDYYVFIIVISISVALQSQYQVAKRTLQGLLKIKETVILSLISSLIGVSVALPLIILFGLEGAVYSFAIIAGLAFIVAHFYLKRIAGTIVGLKLSLGKIESEHAKNLIKFGGANSTVFLSNMLSLLAIRSIIINKLGPEANGLYQVAIGVATTYLNIIATSIWQYGMPKVATILGDVKAIQLLQNQALRLSMLVLVPLIIVLLTTREIWIPLLFSSQFLGAYSLVSWQLLGEFFRSVKWGPNIVNQPYERYRFIILQSIANAIINLVVFFILFESLGLIAAPLSYAITHGIMIPIVLSVHSYYDKFQVTKENSILFLSSSLLVGLSMFIFNKVEGGTTVNYLIIFSLLIIWLYANTNKNERRSVLHLITKKIKK